MHNSFRLKLQMIRMATPTVLHLEFAPPDLPFTFSPGQFVTFHFELDGESYSRSYSIASIPTKTSGIEIAVSPFQGGPGTRKLFSMKVGDEIETTGPFGRLILRDEPIKRYILIATGTGVTPYRAMLPELVRRIEQQNVEAYVLLGVQSPQELLYGEDFLDYAKQTPHLYFHAFYSRAMPEQPQAHEHQGYVQTAFEWLPLNPQTDVVYLCGNPNMIDNTFSVLRERGFETPQVRREKYISPRK